MELICLYVYYSKITYIYVFKIKCDHLRFLWDMIKF